MSDPDQEFALAAARFLGLKIDPAHLPGVAANLALLSGHADRIAQAPLSPAVEPAPVFRP